MKTRGEWMLELAKQHQLDSLNMPLICKPPLRKDKWAILPVEKIDLDLAFAMQTAEGPFPVDIWIYGLIKEEAHLTTTEIRNICRWDEVYVVRLLVSRSLSPRRWRPRLRQIERRE
jgi:hypothetical protein